MNATTILMIDDSEVDRYTYRRYLRQSTIPYQVYEAEDIKHGLALVKAHNPDCILLDLRLKGYESGFEVLQQLVGGEGHYKRKVIILTGLDQRSLRQEALSLGASGYLVKGKTTAVGLDWAIQQALEKTAEHQLNGSISMR